jgi:phosphohistidine phosphatase
MKYLILCRHAKTESIYDGITDMQRQLVPRGYSDAALVVEKMIQLGYDADLLVTSHAVRANQTTNIIANALAYSVDKILYEQFIYDGYTTNQFLDFLDSVGNGHNTIWVVGHNPDIAMVAMRLAIGDFSHFPTSSTAVIAFDVDNWSDVTAKSGKLLHFIFPKMLKE